jgi:hypothetical protein
MGFMRLKGLRSFKGFKVIARRYDEATKVSEISSH